MAPSTGTLYNTKTLMGEHMPEGKAHAIMAVCMFGACLPTEKHRHIYRLECWKNSAKFALNKDTITTVLKLLDQEVQVIICRVY